jgi:hypothetical protein
VGHGLRTRGNSVDVMLTGMSMRSWSLPPDANSLGEEAQEIDTETATTICPRS